MSHEFAVGASAAPLTCSIVIPCYNDAVLLRRCLGSVQKQTVAPAEVLVVDNGSTDDSESAAKEFGARVVEEPRRGITWAVHTGFNAARGDIFLRTDADTVLRSDYVAKSMEAWREVLAAESSQAQGGRGSGRKVVAMTGAARFELPSPWAGLLSRVYLGAYRLTAGAALGHAPIFGTNCSIRRSWWLSVRDGVDYSDPVVHEDLHLSFAVRPDETVAVRDEIGVEMDPRALRGIRQMARRFYRGFYTIFSNWRKQSPQQRLWQRLQARR
ncbi:MULTISPECIES: glycosyltransferase family 2 protein [Corynebacterium]|uniref:glycosyltransferase family 2 protein n=1 Tax=Corynebacterium TaxID=1716 RepID=UPI00257CA468|nr:MULTISPECIES: glycosyltransferase family 2 protein [Corynebacterium]